MFDQFKMQRKGHVTATFDAPTPSPDEESVTELTCPNTRKLSQDKIEKESPKTPSRKHKLLTKDAGRPKVPLHLLPGVPELLGDSPLRLIIVGHNPSEHAWRSGHVYSNPSNWMWRILRETGIAPPSIRGAEDDARMVEAAGVGFVDVGTGHPGTDSSEFDSKHFSAWIPVFYGRLAAHTQRASASAGCSCGHCGAPCIVAFAGKRQWGELLSFNKTGKSKLPPLSFGVQTIRPAGWPLPSSTEIRVLTSTSGAAPMTNQERFAPFQELAAALEGIPWPRGIRCSIGEAQ